MKKGMVIAVSIAAVAVIAGSAYAGCGSCPGDKPKAKAATSSSSSAETGYITNAQLSGLGLTSTQTKRVAAARSLCDKKIKAILTADQKKKLAAACAPAKCAAPAKKGGCR